MNFADKKIFTPEERKDLEKKVEDAIVEKLKAEVRYLINEYLKQEITTLPDITDGNDGIVIAVSSWNKCYEEYPHIMDMLCMVDVQPFHFEKVYGGIRVSYKPGEAQKTVESQKPVEASKTVEAPKPDETLKTEETSKTVESQKTEETLKPVITPVQVLPPRSKSPLPTYNDCKCPFCNKIRAQNK